MSVSSRLHLIFKPTNDILGVVKDGNVLKDAIIRAYINSQEAGAQALLAKKLQAEYTKIMEFASELQPYDGEFLTLTIMDAEPGGGEDEAKRRAPNPPAQRANAQSIEQLEEQLMNDMMDVALASLGVNVQSVRDDYKMFSLKWGKHQTAMLSILAVSCAMNIKKVIEEKMKGAIAQLKEVPPAFQGNGGNFKAFVYLGYDLAMWAVSSDAVRGGVPVPAWLIRLLPGIKKSVASGDIRDYLTMGIRDDESKDAILTRTKKAFDGYAPNPDYGQLLIGTYNPTPTGNRTLEKIKSYDPDLDKKNRGSKSGK